MQAGLVHGATDHFQDPACIRIVSMNTDGIGTYHDRFALRRLDHSLGHHPDDTGGDSLRVLQERTLMDAGDQRTICLVCPVAKCLGCKRDARLAGRDFVLRFRQSQQDQVRSSIPACSSKRARKQRIPG